MAAGVAPNKENSTVATTLHYSSSVTQLNLKSGNLLGPIIPKKVENPLSITNHNTAYKDPKGGFAKPAQPWSLNQKLNAQPAAPTKVPSDSHHFLYEPSQFSYRLIRQWEAQSGKVWRQLSPKSRGLANKDLELLQSAKQANISNDHNQSTVMHHNVQSQRLVNHQPPRTARK
jgi:hypothetical protein